MYKERTKIYTPPWKSNIETGKSNNQLRRERAERLKSKNQARRAKRNNDRKTQNVNRRKLDSIEGRYYQGERTRLSLLLHDFSHSFASPLVAVGCVLFGFSCFNLLGLESTLFADSQLLKWVSGALSSIVHAPFQKLFLVIGISLPEWPIDIAVLWFGMAGFMLRTMSRERSMLAKYGKKGFGKLTLRDRNRKVDGARISASDIAKRGKWYASILASIFYWPEIAKHNLKLPFITVHIERRKKGGPEKINVRRVKKFRSAPSGFFVDSRYIMLWHLFASTLTFLGLCLIGMI